MGELMLIAGALAWTVLLAWRVHYALNQMRAVMRRVADRKHEVHYYEPVIIVEVEGPLDEDGDIAPDISDERRAEIEAAVRNGLGISPNDGLGITG